MLAWMLYAMAIGLIVAGAAFALDGLAAIWGLPRRAVWMLAIAIAVVVPPVLAFRRAPAHRAAITTDVQRVSIRFDGTAVSETPAASVQPPPTRFVMNPMWDRGATLAWIGASIILLGLLAHTFVVVRRHRQGWRESEIDGHRVLIAADVGPAVVGALRPRIVLPNWALTLDDAERRMMLRHEAEHVRAGDPALLLLSAIVVALLPWNPALWLLARQLRLAIEIDCDRRVLRVVDAPREYGMLLLAVGARHSTSLPLAASLAERQPLLERRILAMTSLRPDRPLVASLPFIAALALTGAVAAQTPQPDSLAAIRDRAATVAARAAIARSARASAVASAAIAVEPAEAAAPATTAAAASDIEQTLVAKAAASARAATAAVADSVVLAPSAEVTRKDVPLDTITMWIARYHPDVIRGNGHANRVTIVIGLDEQYLASSVEDANTVSPAQAIKREDIESVQVLKGAAAIATYGPAAEHGIVMIRTKAASDSAIYDDEHLRALAQDLRRTEAGLAQVRINASSMDPIFVVDGVVVPSSDVARAGLVSPAGSSVANMNIAPNRILQVDVVKLPAGQIGPDATSVIVIQLKDNGR